MNASTQKLVENPRPRSKHIRPPAVFAVVVALGTLLSACGSSTASSSSSSVASTAAAQSASIAVIPVSDEFAPDYGIVQSGGFKAQGVNMSLVNVESGSALVTSLESGTADYTQAPIGVLAEAVAHGAPITIFAMAQPVAGFELESKAGSSYSSVQSLKGQKIGISAAGSITAQYAAFTNQKDNLGATLVPVGATGQVSSLESGEVAAVVEVAPSCYTLASQGQSKVLVNYATAVPTMQAWAASTSFLKSHQGLTTKVLKAWYTGLKQMDANKALGESPFLTTFKEPTSVAALQYKYIVKDASLSPAITLQDIQNAYSLLAAGGTTGLPPAKSLTTSQFVSAVGSVG